MFTEDPLHVLVGEDDLEGRGDLVLGGAAADIEEVGGVAAEVLDDVHRAHGQAGAVDEAGVVTVERDVGEVELRGLDLLRVLLGEVAQGDDFGVAEEGVVVEADLGVEGEDASVAGGDEGVDLDERAVEFPPALVEGLDELAGGLELVALEAEAEGDLPGLETLETDGGVDEDLGDLLGGLLGDLLDLNAALGGGDDDGAGGAAVEEDGEVVLLLDGDGLGEVDGVDLAAGGTGLDGDEGVAEHVLGDIDRFGGVLVSLTPPLKPSVKVPLPRPPRGSAPSRRTVHPPVS
jgi:hypothetical protein